MSDAVIIIVIQSITAVVTAISAVLVVVLRNGFRKVKEEVVIVKEKVETVHTQINSRMDELLKLTQTASKAEGKVEGVAEEKAKNSQ